MKAEHRQTTGRGLRTQPARASWWLCASWSSATLLDLKGYMQRPVDAQLFV